MPLTNLPQLLFIFSPAIKRSEVRFATLTPSWVFMMDEVELNNVGTKYAGFFVRILAFALDALLIFFCGAVAYTLGNVLSLGNDGATLLKNIALLISFSYLASAEAGKHQATIGKRIFKICVRDKNNKKISQMRAFFRWLLSQFLFPGFFLLLFNKERMTVLDWVTSTRVIYRADEVSPNPIKLRLQDWWYNTARHWFRYIAHEYKESYRKATSITGFPAPIEGLLILLVRRIFRLLRRTIRN